MYVLQTQELGKEDEEARARGTDRVDFFVVDIGSKARLRRPKLSCDSLRSFLRNTRHYGTEREMLYFRYY